MDEIDPSAPVSDRVVQVAGWVLGSGDNRGLPFAIVDKKTAQVLVFGADGTLKGMAPALIGAAEGDRSAPGVGEIKDLSEIAPEDRTTPAGRFVAGYGPAAGGRTVLWVDYASAVSLHPLAETSPEERRRERLASPEPDDNRITYGCINVSPIFYRQVVRPTFRKTGVFYVLPDDMPLQAAIPTFQPPGAVASVKTAAGPSRVGRSRKGKTAG